MKEFRKVKDWNEWLKLWDKNELWEIATTLLHIGPTVPYQQGYGIIDNTIEITGLYKKIRFYLKIAEMDEYPFESALREVGEKAYQVLVHNLLKKLVKEMEYFKGQKSPTPEIEIPVWREIIEFFAHKERSVLDKEPYTSEANMFVIQLQLSLGDSGPFPFSFSSETKKSLSENKDSVAMALVSVRAFDHILDQKIFEAIPPLEETIVHWCWEYSPGEADMKREFPEGKEEWQKALENPASEALRFALKRVLPTEKVTTLMALIALRG